MPKVASGTKDVDFLLKIVVPVHLLRSFLTHNLRYGVNPDFEPALDIDESTIRAALHVMVVSRKHFNVIRDFVKSETSFVPRPFQSTSNAADKSLNPSTTLGMILLTPGNFTTSRIVGRYFRSIADVSTGA